MPQIADDNKDQENIMLNEYANKEYTDLQSLLSATKSSVTETGQFEKLVPDLKTEEPAWDCNGGVCVLEWKPKKKR